MTPIETVETFVACWNRCDMDAVAAMLHDDIVWDNIPLGPYAGKAAVRAAAAGFMAGVEGCAWEIHRIAANGAVVLTERTDRFTLTGGRPAAIRVMGVFELDDARLITQWRDYFDMAEFQREFAGAIEN